MGFVTDHPVVLAVVSAIAMWIMGRLGIALSRWQRPGEAEVRETFNVVQGATLTLLGLIIGFSFSMAISRYDQRKNYEEAEANAIGTEYVRLDFLQPADAGKARALLSEYLRLRIRYYGPLGPEQLRQLDVQKNAAQAALWSIVTPPAQQQPNPVMALVVSGMNDVLNSEGYTQAAWWNRIPTAAWILMFAIALACNLMLGIGARGSSREPVLLLVLPVIIGISFMLIADIDSPRGGLIRVVPQNLTALANSLGPH
ncbi:hypothetical protein [Dyella sp. C9]|uniref:bestrophin-like domain n=1 Tax=Dyella sp. C9 TaxID=2202154 RepID=UPI000DEF8687|nr:hypothetical protein [Dyella sp. C9]